MRARLARIWAAALATAGLLAVVAATHAQEPAQAALRAHMIGDDLLAGFTAVQPENEGGGASGDGRPALPLPDAFRLGVPIATPDAGSGVADMAWRAHYSQDGAYVIRQQLVLCDALVTVDGYMRVRPVLNLPTRPGTLLGATALGDRSWAYADAEVGSLILFRVGRAVYSVSASRARRGRDTDAPQYPKEAVQALADTVFLRIARKPEIAGKPLATAAVTVNGKVLAARAPLVAGRVAVPVLEVAKQAGWQAAWDARNAQARLKPPSGADLVLTFASPTATVGEGVIPLRSALFKDGDVAVMDVEELAALMGGAVENAEGRVSVRI